LPIQASIQKFKDKQKLAIIQHQLLHPAACSHFGTKRRMAVPIKGLARRVGL
jgi:glycyl-tRNA synthetase beta subunit